jgi:ATP-dependent DNA helicase RecQ
MTAAASRSRTVSPTRVRALLKDRFGLARLRPGQQAVIDRVLAGRATLAVMPTGAGKSLCYQLPALLLPGRTLVVSPLIALMKDQCESMRELGIAAVQTHSAVPADEAREAEAAIADGSAKIVMTTPERLAEPEFGELLAAHPVSLLTVDEAHCISQWGHDFRPAFLEVGAAWQRLGKPVVLALTATAGSEVEQDICEQLHIPRDGVINASCYRPNLDLRVEPVAGEEDKLERVAKLVHGSAGQGIVYTATVKAAEAVHEALVAAGESVGLYHGRLPAAERHAQQEAFMGGERRVMVATNAFGLGIDKPDIRFVLHYQLPPRVEAYYQEAGRAGRDGKPSRCTLIFLRGDKAIQQFFLVGRYPTDDDAVALYQALTEPSPDGEAWTLALLQGRLARPRGKLQVALGLLRRQGIVQQHADGAVQLLQPDLPPSQVRELMQSYEGKRKQDRDALEHMMFYAQTGQCRWRVLLDELDEGAPFERCGHCDNCRRIQAHEKVIAHLEQQQDAASSDAARTADDAGWRRGDIVKVRRYGRGIVEQATSVQVTVKFADGSRRAFLPEYVSGPGQAGRVLERKGRKGSAEIAEKSL